MKTIKIIMLSLFLSIGVACEKESITNTSTERIEDISIKPVKFVLTSIDVQPHIKVEISNMQDYTMIPITTEYFNVSSITTSINKGNKIVITIYNPNNYINCNYTLYNNDNTIQWQVLNDNQSYAVNRIEKHYILQ